MNNIKQRIGWRLIIVSSLLLLLNHNFAVKYHSNTKVRIKVKIFSLIKLKQLIFQNNRFPFQVTFIKKDDRQITFKPVKKVSITLSRCQLVLNDHTIYKKLKHIKSIYVMPSSTKNISVGNELIPPRPYSGSFIINLKKEELTCVNQLVLSQYLVSVVSSEMWGVGNSLDSLKAQAISSRSYAYAKLHTHTQQSYNYCDTTHCQVYQGNKNINALIVKAVSETQNEVLTYQNKIISAYYHSTCGGRTTAAKNVFRVRHNYLKGIKDEDSDGIIFCKDSPHFIWNRTITRKQLLTIFSRKQPNFPIKLANLIYDWSGRVIKINIRYPDHSLTLSGEEFRIMLGRKLGWSQVKSSAFRIDSLGNEAIHFQGRGLGHGVGLCQYGAAKMGSLGYSYLQILNHYFPKCQVTQLKNN